MSQDELMEGEHGAASDTAAVNGMPSPTEGTSISPYGTRRYTLRSAQRACRLCLVRPPDNAVQANVRPCLSCYSSP